MINVHTIKAGTVFAWFMLVMILRRVVMLIVAGIARRGKPFPPGSRVPEDIKLRGGGNVEVTTETSGQVEFTKDVRVNKTIATAVFSDTESRNSTRTIVYGLIYLVARIFYAVAYIMALQPWRSILFGVGLAATLACSLDLVITMSLRPN